MNTTHPFHGPPMTPEPFEAQLPPPRPPCCAPPPMKTLDWEKPRQIPKFANPDHTQGKPR